MLVVVIDDDPLVLEGMGGLIPSWGCSVVTGSTDGAVLDELADFGEPPNALFPVIICVTAALASRRLRGCAKH